MTEPTKEQLKEFWEWCGLTHKRNKDGTLIWYDLGGHFIAFGYILLDLNNLFKYAVPKISDKWQVSISIKLPNFYLVTLDEVSESLTRRQIFVLTNNPVQSLFEAVWEAIKEE